MDRSDPATSARRWLITVLFGAMLATGCTRCTGSLAGKPISWKKIQDGLDYATFTRRSAQFHVLRLNLARQTLRIVDARRTGRTAARVSVLTREGGSIAGVNGTFFDTDLKPIGWLVSAGHEINPLHDTSWWAALIIRIEADQPVAEVLTTDEAKALPPVLRASVRFAIQVGPRTVVDGKPVKLKKQRAPRTAACVTKPQEVLLIVAQHSIGANDLAEIMAEPAAKGGLGCRSGLMFDGGPSSQLFVQSPTVNVDVPGGSDVPDAVVVVPHRTPPPAAE